MATTSRNTSQGWVARPHGDASREPMPPRQFARSESHGGTTQCPFCRETILVDAIKCRFCHEMLAGLRPGDQVVSVGRPPARADARPDTSSARAPIEPQSGSVAFGLCMTILSAWLLLDWIPSHRPLPKLDQATMVVKGLVNGVDRTGHWMFSPELYPWAYVIAAVIGFLGLRRIIRGATHRPT